MKEFATAKMMFLGGWLAGAAAAAVITRPYGRLPDGRAVESYTLTNVGGISITLLNYGALLASLSTPDRHGQRADITLGSDSLADWLANDSYMGATIGRYANRIAHGRFTLDGKGYELVTNNSPAGRPCHLHGGRAGFDRKLWTATAREHAGNSIVEFSYTSPEGEEGYPGTLTAKVTYTLTADNELRIHYEATTDKRTLVNLTNHTYWNLTGDPRRTVLNHRLTIASDEMIPVDAGLIPTGRRAAVSGSPFDFTKERAIGEAIETADQQLEFGGGYDHCWVLRPGEEVRLAARVYEPVSGRVMEVFTDQPGLQFYSGNFLDGSLRGKGGIRYEKRTGFCLEPGKFPDSPNHPEFPSAVLAPGALYRHAIVFKFGIQ